MGRENMRLILAGLLALGVAMTAQADAQEAHARYAQELQRLGPSTAGDSGTLARLTGRSSTSLRGLSAGERLAALLNAHWAWSMQITPESATFTGFPGQNQRWSDYSLAAQEPVRKLEKLSLRVAQDIAPGQLSRGERLNLELFIHGLNSRVDGHAFPQELLPLNQMYGAHLSLPQVLGAMPLFSHPQVEDYLARLAGIPTLIEQVIEALEAGLDQGITPPRITLAKVPDQVRGLAPAKPADSPLLQPLWRIETDLAQASQARDRASTVYTEQIRPALQRLVDYLERQYLPGARSSTALSALPNGRPWYAWLVQAMTTTELSPKEIHAIGLAEVVRLNREMRQVMRELDYRGTDVPAFVARLKSDRSQFYTRAEELLRDYRALAKQADGGLVKLFKQYPSLPYAVEPIPEYAAAGSPVAYYLPGSADNGRPGTFFVNTLRLSDAPKYEMQALLLHEAVPGHHFQLALAQEQSGLPEFRRHARFTAFIEGWGLYAESLGPQLGFYQTPQSRFGALSFEMWRAVRLVVDTGMHAMGWSRQQAIDYFRRHTGQPLPRIETEVDRYLVIPGQALAYKMGQLKIQGLRENAKQQLGERFELREFHGAVLRNGALPLQILEQQIDLWLAQQRAETR